VLPQGVDNFVNAERCTEAGVGITLMPHEVNAQAGAGAAQTLLTVRHYQTRALEIADEIGNMAEPPELVRVLESLP
jgi:UDP:flavonoid glycosyltransferase YjiC (YdhE family)